MRRIIIGLFLVLLIALPASATSIVWSSASLSDDNGGLFLSGATVSDVGATFTLDLPSYSTTSQFGFPPNEVDLGVTATALGGDPIVGLAYTFLGSFTGFGSAAFLVTANAAFNSGSFSTSPKVGLLTFPSATSVNIGTVLNLDDGGDFAAVRRVQFTVATVPEPSAMMLLGSGLPALAWRARARRRSRSRSSPSIR